ncbi:MAG TPA: folate family ECF transporter S component, partial [Clostridiales bacterium]|nr:folate family ECF transporter S component [Clostridiales bacterium]
GEPLSMIYVIGFLALVLAYIIVPIVITSKLKFNIKTNKILFMVSIIQFVTSIILNTYFLSVLYGKGYLVFLPARVLSNFFIIPIYTVVIATILEAVNKRFKLNI